MTREKPSIAVTLKRLRRRARLSQRRLADLSDVSPAAIARIEYGFDRKSGGPVKPEPETLRRLAHGLAMTEDGPSDDATLLRVYRELLEAAGYDALILELPTQEATAARNRSRSSPRLPGSPEGMTPIELQREIARVSGDREISVDLVWLATHRNRIPTESLDLVKLALKAARRGTPDSSEEAALQPE